MSHNTVKSALFIVILFFTADAISSSKAVRLEDVVIVVPPAENYDSCADNIDNFKNAFIDIPENHNFISSTWTALREIIEFDQTKDKNMKFSEYSSVNTNQSSECMLDEKKYELENIHIPISAIVPGELSWSMKNRLKTLFSHIGNLDDIDGDTLVCLEGPDTAGSSPAKINVIFEHLQNIIRSYDNKQSYEFDIDSSYHVGTALKIAKEYSAEIRLSVTKIAEGEDSRKVCQSKSDFYPHYYDLINRSTLKFGKTLSELSSDHIDIIDNDVLAQFKPPGLIVIEGYASEAGTNKKNAVLSDNRTNAVYNYILQSGLKPESIEAFSHGETAVFASQNKSTLEQLAENQVAVVSVYRVNPALVNEFKQGLPNLPIQYHRLYENYPASSSACFNNEGRRSSVPNDLLLSFNFLQSKNSKSYINKGDWNDAIAFHINHEHTSSIDKFGRKLLTHLPDTSCDSNQTYITYVYKIIRNENEPIFFILSNRIRMVYRSDATQSEFCAMVNNYKFVSELVSDTIGACQRDLNTNDFITEIDIGGKPDILTLHNAEPPYEFMYDLVIGGTRYSDKHIAASAWPLSWSLHDGQK